MNRQAIRDRTRVGVTVRASVMTHGRLVVSTKSLPGATDSPSEFRASHYASGFLIPSLRASILRAV